MPQCVAYRSHVADAVAIASANCKAMNPRIATGVMVIGLLCFTAFWEMKPELLINRPIPWRTVYIYQEELDDGRDIPPPIEVSGAKPSRLLYLVLTESCLPNNLSSAKVIGDPSICNCDVLVLSYRSACNETTLAHVGYIFNSSTSWGTGRNLLFEVAKRRKEKYLYYIFIDDDVILISKIKKKNPWRIFEAFLNRVEPAIGAIDNTWYPFLQIGIDARKMLGCNPVTSDYVPSARFDGAFNAFHYQAADYVLPYLAKFDEHNWSLADLYTGMKMEIYFAGQSVLHTQLYITNPKHRPYARREMTSIYVVSLLDIIEQELPVKYRNSSVLSDWKNDRFGHVFHSKTYCLPPPPPHTPIKPFAYSP